MTRSTNRTFLYTHLMRWEPLILKGGEGKAWIKTLARDEQTGARTMLMRFDPGYAQSEVVGEWPVDMYVLEGEMRCGDRRYEEGTFHYRPAGTKFGPIECPKGITRLMFTAESKSVSSPEEVFIQNVTAMPWSPSYVDSDIRKRGLRILREDRVVNITLLIHGHFVPGTILPGEMHFHDHHEEGFTLTGENEDYLADVDGHIMWVPGTYFCRTIGASGHGDAFKKTAPQMQIVRRGWVGETEKFWESQSDRRSSIPAAVELAE